MGTGGLAQGLVALASEEEQDWGVLPAPRSWPRDDARKQADKIQLSERAQGWGEEGRRPAGVRVAANPERRWASRKRPQHDQIAQP